MKVKAAAPHAIKVPVNPSTKEALSLPAIPFFKLQ